jgi:hypothetical protein
MPYIMINLMFFVPIPIAIVFDAFRGKRSGIAIEDSIIEKEALFICYTTMIKNDDGDEMTYGEWKALMNEVYKNNLAGNQINKLFMI